MMKKRWSGKATEARSDLETPKRFEDAYCLSSLVFIRQEHEV